MGTICRQQLARLSKVRRRDPYYLLDPERCVIGFVPEVVNAGPDVSLAVLLIRAKLPSLYLTRCFTVFTIPLSPVIQVARHRMEARL